MMNMTDYTTCNGQLADHSFPKIFQKIAYVGSQVEIVHQDPCPLPEDTWRIFLTFLIILIAVNDLQSITIHLFSPHGFQKYSICRVSSRKSPSRCLSPCRRQLEDILVSLNGVNDLQRVIVDFPFPQ